MADEALIEAMARAVCAKRRVVCVHLPCECTGWKAYAAEQRVALTALRKTHAVVTVLARPGEEYHEDMGNVLWWRFPIVEPPYVGMPDDSDWPGYHTHFTPIPMPMLNASEATDAV